MTCIQPPTCLSSTSIALELWPIFYLVSSAMQNSGGLKILEHVWFYINPKRDGQLKVYVYEIYLLAHKKAIASRFMKNHTLWCLYRPWEKTRYFNAIKTLKRQYSKAAFGLISQFIWTLLGFHRFFLVAFGHAPTKHLCLFTIFTSFWCFPTEPFSGVILNSNKTYSFRRILTKPLG